jgi:hypothetical protein
MSAAIGFREGLLCIRQKRHGLSTWLPVRPVDDGERETLEGRPVQLIDAAEGIYVDEQGTVYQLRDKGATKPLKVEPPTGTEKSELEGLLEASLEGRAGAGHNGGA